MECLSCNFIDSGSVCSKLNFFFFQLGKTQPTHMKNLCEDNLNPTQDIGELMGLCSGQFASYSEEKRTQMTKNQGALSDLVLCQDNPDEDHHNAEEELLELCTAKFPT